MPLAAILAFAIGAIAMTAAPATADQLTPAEARAIAKEATIYGFPLVDNYRVQYSYFVDRGGDQYKAPWNTLVNNARVYTPVDTAIQTPNSDTPYSFIGADLRAEPLVFSVPAIDKDRYYSLQFIDMYTFNFGYVGSRATGDDAGAYLLAGPGWHGETPPGVKAVIRSETEFAFVIYRTQLFGPDDIDNVKKIQAGYKVQPLSQFLGKPAPPAPPAVDFIKPLSPEAERTSPEFFNILNFVLGFCPPNPAETEIMARFAKLGIGPHGTFDAKALSPEMLKAVEDGMSDAWAEFKTYKETELDTGKRTSADAFGTREFLHGDYLARFSGAVLGIYGNSKDEAIYPLYFVDSAKKPLSGANRYELRFAPGDLPPVNAFWSLTLYELPSSLLSANPLNRYLINSAMLPRPQARRRWRRHACRPARRSGSRWPGELAAGADRTVFAGDAALLAEGRRARWKMDRASACSGRATTSRRRLRPRAPRFRSRPTISFAPKATAISAISSGRARSASCSIAVSQRRSTTRPSSGSTAIRFIRRQCSISTPGR